MGHLLTLFSGARTSGGTPAFSPLDLNPFLWLDASNGPLITTGDPAGIGDPVEVWNDLSGNANYASQYTTAKQPTLQSVTNGGQTFNVVRFDAADDRMDSLADALTGISTGSVFLVSKWTSAATSVLLQFAKYDIAWINSGTLQLSDTGIKTITGYAYTPDNAWHVHSADFSLSGANVTGTLYQDGTLKSTATVTQSASVHAFEINATDGGALVLGQDVSEIVIFSGVLSAPNRALMDTYLSSKYGTP